MACIDITEDTFKSTIEANPIAILDFWAEWCGPCKGFSPVFEAASERHPDVVFGKIDTEAEHGLAGAFEIRSIPTLMVIRDEIMVFRESGALPAGALEQLITQIKTLDMDEVRAQMQADGADEEA